ncbi:hypothetical protein [Peribacillus simplex]|uniref:hypothetical protein n=1 Tax=Peribacillus simplex TaxID=1478 RepID=UPI0011A0E637|nr:hypothetical protein [Peribacillus simplex]
MNNKGRFYFCYNREIYHYLSKERGHWFIFSGFTNKSQRVVIFEVTEQLTKDLQEFYGSRHSSVESW